MLTVLESVPHKIQRTQQHLSRLHGEMGPRQHHEGDGVGQAKKGTQV